MKKKKKEVPELNSSSTADISFLLLIFFLLTTSMDTDQGLARRLPPPPEQNQKNDDIKLKERNVLQVFLNFQDQLLCGGEYIGVSDLRKKAKEFIANEANDATKPEKHVVHTNLLGDLEATTNHVISLRCDRGTSYNSYIAVQNELVAAYNELRDEMATARFGKAYADCDEIQQEDIRTVYPQNISEAEPKKYGDK